VDLTAALYDRLANDATLTGLLAAYRGEPAVFTTDPAPGDAAMPFVVAAGAVADVSFDTKTGRGRDVTRDVRCYAEDNGSALVVEEIAERVRVLLHRHALSVVDFVVWVAECSGPIVADESGAYGRIVTVRILAEEV